MNKIEQAAKASESRSFRELNPNLFGESRRNACVQSSNLKGGLIRQDSKPLMNKLESEFYTQLQLAGWPTILIQSLKFRLGNGVGFTPDFVCVGHDMKLRAYETKGFMRDDAGVKIKVAAFQYPWISWRLVWKNKGQWTERVVLP